MMSHSRWMKRFAGVAVLLGTVSACQTGPVDSGGRGMQLTAYKSIPLEEADTTIPLLISEATISIAARTRDNRITEQRISFQYSGGRFGKFFIQRSPTWYSANSFNKARDEEEFRSRIDRRYERPQTVMAIQTVNHQKHASGGFFALVNGENNWSDCVYAFSGYRLGSPTVYDNDRGHFDTFLELEYCAPGASIAPFKRALENIEIVKDRPAFQAKLAEIKSAKAQNKETTLSRTVRGVWDGVEVNLKGLAWVSKMPNKDENELKVSFGKPELACAGYWKEGPATISHPDINRGAWNLTCENGSDLVGSSDWNGDFYGEATGADTDGNRFKLEF